MAINVRVSDFLGIALRGLDDDAQMLVLAHRDPALNIPLCASSDHEEILSAWQMWSDILALPLLAEDDHDEPAARRRRHNAIRARRPKFLLVRRRGGNLTNLENVHQDEREIIAGIEATPVVLQHHTTVVPREGGGSSTPRPIDSSSTSLEGSITRLRG